ncbi:Na/Pi symporter [Endozoicomonas sp. 4G]|uniref:Na/Pi cotransporter family protein n=1 Tax=Endozoicomonas sp. 4G TaxID=2872754 RepID=UPI002078A61F|nr:Na/Pi symporter [Endozoicomonas sp. 4G]
MSFQSGMLGRLFLPFIIVILTYGFWVSPQFRVIAAGVAIFLFGMVYLEQGFKVYTGGLLETLLKKTTDKIWKSLSFGVISTAFLQSSSLVSVIVISFLSAGLIGLTAGIGIIFGANLGSTAGAWLVALFGLKVKLSAYAMPLLVIGLILKSNKHRNINGFGYILLGIGFLFLGIDFMKVGFDAFRSSIDLAEFAMQGFLGVLVYTGAGMLATIIMQSTNATMVLTFSALAAGQLSYENALALAIGSNIGTTITAILGAISANAEGKRLAVAHLAFNIITAFIAIVALKPLMGAVDYLASASGIAANNYTLKLAIFHSLFNIIGIMALLPFLNKMVHWLQKLFTDNTPQAPLNLAGDESLKVERAIYLNPVTLSYPDTALRAITKECGHLYRNTLELICYGIYLSGEKLRESDNLEELVQSWRREDQPWTIKELYIRHVKGIYADIIQYSGALEGKLPRQQAQELFALKVACRDFVQAIKHVKHIYKNMGKYTQSENEQIREQYNQLRLCLASVLKLVDILGVRRSYSHIREHADQLKKELRERDGQTHETLNKLIRSGQVDPFIASSLLNDSAHVHDACTNLIDGAVIMLTRDREEYHEFDISSEQSSEQSPDPSAHS